MRLNEIGRRHGTDKSDLHHGYLDIYERVLPRQLRGSLLELGWLDGASVRTWREWLPHWEITGLDIDSKEPIPGINFVQGKQDDPAVLDLLDEYDVIIDDASHESDKTIASFELLWPHLKSHGLYFIEDIQTSYFPTWNFRGGPSAMQYFKDLADLVNSRYTTEMREDVAHVGFWPGLVLVVKA